MKTPMNPSATVPRAPRKLTGRVPNGVRPKPNPSPSPDSGASTMSGQSALGPTIQGFGRLSATSERYRFDGPVGMVMVQNERLATTYGSKASASGAPGAS